MLLACALLLLLAAVHARRAPEEYQFTLLGHRSYKRPDQIRSPLPLFHVKDGRDNSFAVPESYSCPRHLPRTEESIFFNVYNLLAAV